MSHVIFASRPTVTSPSPSFSSSFFETRAGRALVKPGPWAVGAVGWLVVSLVWSLHSGNWQWFGRAGSIATLIGAALLGRAIAGATSSAEEASRGPDTWVKDRVATVAETFYAEDGTLRSRLRVAAPASRRTGSGEDPASAARRNQVAAALGLWLTVAGMLVWGYGDLTGRRLGRSEVRASSVATARRPSARVAQLSERLPERPSDRFTETRVAGR